MRTGKHREIAKTQVVGVEMIWFGFWKCKAHFQVLDAPVKEKIFLNSVKRDRPGNFALFATIEEFLLKG
ncbi:MAG: hypothetical protein J4F48_06740 [Nitrospinae bacterium]|nr:hypothetical protein [Nitrospinota bacterium]